jgi:excisionase family DNA binding protein
MGQTSTTAAADGKDKCKQALTRETYTVEEAAAILGISRATAYRPGVLPVVRIGGRLLVPRRALRRLLGEDA